MNPRWQMIPADEEAVHHLSNALSLPWPVARVLVSRGFTKEEDVSKFLDTSLDKLENPLSLPGMKEAAVRLADAIEKREAILVHGDFDADGITSTAVLARFLNEFDSRVQTFIPNRLFEGHGISPKAIEKARTEQFSLVITCDCGISSAKEIQQLHELGIETIVTDHHQIPGEIPKTAILVNPHLGEEETSHDELSGVGVAFMLTVATRMELRTRNFFTSHPEPNLREYLDIVALGTIADLAPLRGQNRILVARGLMQFENTRKPGLLAMLEQSGFQVGSAMKSEDIGYRLAPRINAAARLGHADEALEILMTQDTSRAGLLAKSLEQWNGERRQRQESMSRLAMIEAERQVDEGRRSIVVASEHFHPGVIGLVAQRLAEKFSRPAVIFSVEGETARGSGRSGSGVHLVEALEKLSSMLVSFGGHREAGGCTLSVKNIEAFKREFEIAVRAQKDDAAREIFVDAELNLRHLNERFLSCINRLRPFGVGNPEPVFMARVAVAGLPREVGNDHVRLTLRDSEGPTYPAIGFGLWRSHASVLKGNVEVVYSPEDREWKGRKEIQIRLLGARPV